MTLPFYRKCDRRGLFDGERYFELKDNNNRTTTFVHTERFTGTFTVMFNTDKTKYEFELMNNKLKNLVKKVLKLNN